MSALADAFGRRQITRCVQSSGVLSRSRRALVAVGTATADPSSYLGAAANRHVTYEIPGFEDVADFGSAPYDRVFKVSTLSNVSGMGWPFNGFESPPKMSRATPREASALTLSLKTVKTKPCPSFRHTLYQSTRPAICASATPILLLFQYRT